MSDFALFTTLAAAYIIVSLLRAAWPQRHCPLDGHLLSVAGTRRMRDGLGRRYWIRCRVCDLEHGPYDSWQAAWQDALSAQIAARQQARGAESDLRAGPAR